MSKSHDYLKSLFIRLEEKANKVELQLNKEITEYMVTSIRDFAAVFRHLKIGRYKFSKNKPVKYLGSILTEKKDK
jgi:hypothetical protein